MVILTHKVKQVFLIFLGALVFSMGVAQVPTYTVDEDFNTGETFRAFGVISDYYFHDDGRILVGGSFTSNYVTGLGMINSSGTLDANWGGYEYGVVLKIIGQEDGYVYPNMSSFVKIFLDGTSWGSQHQTYWSEYLMGGTSSPYTVLRVWDIYQMENGDLLLGGAIANDTLLPNEFRGVSRIHADGSHDPTFPVLNLTPNNALGSVHRIFRAADGWYISGGFTAINGHETNRIARLTADFEVDTTFVSPFVYDGVVDFAANIIYVDSLSRVWVSGYQMQLQENPSDTIQIIRLLANGEVDTDFLPRKLNSIYPNSFIASPTVAYRVQELVDEPGRYIVYGQFNYFEDTLQPCITVVDDAGNILHNYFQDQGASLNVGNNSGNIWNPVIFSIIQLEDGSLLIAGGFSEFMGKERYNVVKLKRGFVGVDDPPPVVNLHLYPNPARDVLHIAAGISRIIGGKIYDALGREVGAFSSTGSEVEVDIRSLRPGIYFVKVAYATGGTAVQKFVKTR